jgi:hypothetical protein
MGSSYITGTPEQGRQTEQRDRYALVLLNATGAQLLLRNENGKGALPTVCIPQFMRPAQQITSLIKREWGIIRSLVHVELVFTKSGLRRTSPPAGLLSRLLSKLRPTTNRIE